MLKINGIYYNGIIIFFIRREKDYMMKKKEKVFGLVKKDREYWIDFEFLNR